MIAESASMRFEEFIFIRRSVVKEYRWYKYIIIIGRSNEKGFVATFHLKDKPHCLTEFFPSTQSMAVNREFYLYPS